MTRQSAGDHRPLPARRPPHPRAAHPRHPARPRRLRLRDAAPGAVAARARRRPGARPGVARRPRARSRVRSSARSTRASSTQVGARAAEDRAAGPAAGEAAARPPVHRGHDRQQGDADSATPASRSRSTSTGSATARTRSSKYELSPTSASASTTASSCSTRRTRTSCRRADVLALRAAAGRRRLRVGQGAGVVACGWTGVVAPSACWTCCWRRGVAAPASSVGCGVVSGDGLGPSACVRRRAGCSSSASRSARSSWCARRRRSSSSWDLATEPPKTSSVPVRKNAAIAKPMTPVTSPSTSHVRPRELSPALVLLPQAERVVAALARGGRDVVLRGPAAACGRLARRRGGRPGGAAPR